MSFPNNNRQPEFQDPKIILTTSILRQRDGIVAHMNNGRSADALKGMATLMSQLEIDPDRKDLLAAREELTKNYSAGYLPSTKVMFYFQILNDYLNATYFADFHSFHYQNKNPKHIGGS